MNIRVQTTIPDQESNPRPTEDYPTVLSKVFVLANKHVSPGMIPDLDLDLCIKTLICGWI